MPDFDFDVAVMGGGSAGFAAARTTTSAQLRTVVVEGGADDRLAAAWELQRELDNIVAGDLRDSRFSDPGFVAARAGSPGRSSRARPASRATRHRGKGRTRTAHPFEDALRPSRTEGDIHPRPGVG